MTDQPGEITVLLSEARGGNPEAASRLMAFVYAELHRLAVVYMRREKTGHTLQPTALVNEAYLRLAGAADLNFQDRAHFLGVAANMMRRILVDHARVRNAAKRGGDRQKIEVDEHLSVAIDEEAADLIDLDRALTRLASMDERLSRIVELRYFGGLSAEEIATVLSVSSKTVKRDWVIAKAFLREEMGANQRAAGPLAES